MKEIKKKIGIITLYGNNNFGNKLQNYALVKYLSGMNFEVSTILFKENIYLKETLKNFYKNITNNYKYKRIKKFKKFNKYLNLKLLSEKKVDKFDFIEIGSDQVWNYTFPCFNYNQMFALSSKKERNFSYAASFGVNNVDDEHKEIITNCLNNINTISVREDQGKDIVEELIKDKNVEVLIDPTMLLTPQEWDEVAIKPEQSIDKKYILCYFLGKVSDNTRTNIENFADKKGFKIINLLDPNDDFYLSGPSEFLYLVKNASLICTDSFHACVFSVLYGRPFLIFNNEDKERITMNSRLDTFIDKFNIKDVIYNGEITDNCLTCNYKDAYKILENEKEKSRGFLEKTLKIK